MRIVHFLISGILLTLSLSVFAQIPKCLSDSSTFFTIDKDIYKLITTGQEVEVKRYFQQITFDELIKSDSGVIVKAISKLKSNDKVTRTIWILEEVKNRSFAIKKHLYTELEKVDYKRPSFVLRQLINNYFTNFNETEDTLLLKVSALQKKMNK